MFDTECKTCGKNFQADRRTRRYCCVECSYEGNKHDPRITGRPRGPRTQVVCQQCHKEFSVPHSFLAQGRSKYCSRACYFNSRWGKKLGPFKTKDVRREKTCKACGKTFMAGGRSGVPVEQVLCSMACQLASRYRSGAKSRELTVADAAYLAGLIDGEGSVMLTSRNTSVALTIGVSNNNKDVLDWCVKVTGVGAVTGKPRANPNAKQGYFWRCSSQAAETVLRQVLPYMIIKPAQTALAISFQERLRDPAFKTDRSWQQEWMKQMKAMNARGVQKPQ